MSDSSDFDDGPTDPSDAFDTNAAFDTSEVTANTRLDPLAFASDLVAKALERVDAHRRRCADMKTFHFRDALDIVREELGFPPTKASEEDARRIDIPWGEA